ncbi:MAG: peptidylprolyl isomerase [Mariprofundaceae bacterium]
MRSNFISMFKYCYHSQRTVETFIVGLMALTILACGTSMAEEAVPATASEPATTSESLPAAADQAVDPSTRVFAIVGDMKILMRDFDIEYARIQKERYYHSKVQEHKVAELQREVREKLVDRALISQEVERRADPVNEQLLEQMLGTSMASFDERFGEDEGYQKDREVFVKGMRAKIANSLRIQGIEKIIRDSVTEPDEDALKQYYQENLELFTQPGQHRVSVILLGIDPSLGIQKVMETTEEAKGLVAALRAGSADFSELAEAISTDKSAANGGDMGYQHVGMMAPPVEAVLAEMSEGEISDPIRVLEGVSIFRLEERMLPNVQPFDTVRERILGLWLRENKEKAWTDFVSGLKEGVKIVVYDDFFMPFPDTAADGKENQAG